MVDHPKNPFTLAADLNREKPEQIRDKDNVQQRVPPPRWARTPAGNLAPIGMKGIQRNLPQQIPKPVKHSFAKGDARKVFKSIAPRSPDKNKDIER